jgi:hypothetical protein
VSSVVEGVKVIAQEPPTSASELSSPAAAPMVPSGLVQFLDKAKIVARLILAWL